MRKKKNNLNLDFIDLQQEYYKINREALRNENYRCEIQAVQKENLLVVLGVKRIDKMNNEDVIDLLYSVKTEYMKIYYDGFVIWKE